MNNVRILVTGSNGQLGQCVRAIEEHYPKLELDFVNSSELDITNKQQIEDYFQNESFDYIVNCAAYTNVEQAEKEPEKAFLVNAEGTKNLALICKEHNTTLIHVSTDYVFDGTKETPYTEEDTPNPINEYGKSKLAGERYIEEILDKYFVIRTSWLYSQFGKNFYKTILERSNSQKHFNITTGEIGTPTNANDLARFLFQIIEAQSENYGIYHFSNLGSATWYDFAKEILKNSNKLADIKLKKTDNYPTFALRPEYSVLSKEKGIKTFSYDSLTWENSLLSMFNN